MSILREYKKSRLLRQLKNTDPKKRCSAAEKLGALGDSSIIQSLLCATQEMDINVRYAADKAIHKLCSSGGAELEKWQTLPIWALSSSPEIDPLIRENWERLNEKFSVNVVTMKTTTNGYRMNQWTYMQEHVSNEVESKEIYRGNKNLAEIDLSKFEKYSNPESGMDDITVDKEFYENKEVDVSLLEKFIQSLNTNNVEEKIKEILY